MWWAAAVVQAGGDARSEADRLHRVPVMTRPVQWGPPVAHVWIVGDLLLRPVQMQGLVQLCISAFHGLAGTECNYLKGHNVLTCEGNVL